jgi:LssY C-terminus
MRFLLNLMRGPLWVCAATVAFACDQLPAGQSLWIRLASPISSYTAKVGEQVQAVLTQDVVCEDEVILPMDTPIEGVVRSKRKVGWGIRHETAALELEFNRAVPKSGAIVAFTARVQEVEDARENVRNGVIQGVRSTNTFQGTINSRLIHLPTWNPYSDPVLIAYKAVFPIFPEPEIYYPAGTDIRLRTTSEIALPANASGHEPAHEEKLDADQVEQLVDQLPVRATTTKHVNADLLNVVFRGSEQQVTAAFREAGWHSADTAGRRSWFRNFYALLNNSGYAEQPMMTFLLNGKPEDMNWQKNLNSYGRRDHLRVWRWSSGAGVDKGSADSVWVTSSTHDTSAVLSVKYEGFVHHIAPDIDDERATVIRDLNFAGCVKSVSYVSRPEMPTMTYNATGDVMHTDGFVAVVELQGCHPSEPELRFNSGGGRFRPGSYAFRYIRKEILTFRSDILRANIVYGAFDVGRMTFTALRQPGRKRDFTVAENPAGYPAVFPDWDELSGALVEPTSSAIYDF